MFYLADLLCTLGAVGAMVTAAAAGGTFSS